MKIAGRDAGKKCVIISEQKKERVLVDGETRRRECNVAHLEPLPTTVDIAAGASHQEVKDALAPLGISVRESKPKKAAPRPRILRRSKLAAKPAASPVDKAPTGTTVSGQQLPAGKVAGSVQKKSRAKPKAQPLSSQAGKPDTQGAKTSA